MKDSLGRFQTGVLFGGTSEIGRAIVSALTWQPGARLWLASRRDPGELTVDAEVHVEWVEWDAAMLERAESILLSIPDDIDVVVVAAGALGAAKHPERDVQGSLAVLETTAVGAAAALLSAAERLRLQGHGSLIVLSSIAAVPVRVDNLVYGAAKATLDALAIGLHEVLGASGVEVYVVRPGFVHSKMTAGLSPAPFATTPEAVAGLVANAVAHRRTGVVWTPRILGVVSRAMRMAPRAALRRLSRN